MKIVLASGSPRRVELLRTIVPEFVVDKSEVDETPSTHVDVEAAQEIALRKARAVAARHPDATVIGADTTVWLGEQAFGKPKDRADAIRMLSALNGTTHRVITGVAVVRGERVLTDACVSEVRMHWTAQEIAQYVDEYEPYDKAGAYGLQEFGDAHATFTGDYDNIIGLPVALTARLLAAMEEKV